MAAKPQYKPRKRASEKSKEDAKQARLEAAQAAEEEGEVQPESAEQMAQVSEVLDTPDPMIIHATLANGEEREVKILRCKARQIGFVMRFLANAFKTLGVTSFEQAADLTNRLKDPTEMFVILADMMDDALATAVMLTDLPTDDFRELEVDDALAIAMAVYAVNQAFFLTRVLPMVREMLAREGLDSNNSSGKTQESGGSDT